MTEVDEVVKEFLVESYEGLDQVERDLVSLETSPDDPEILARIFRAVHTIKGTCGFLGFDKLERLNHAAESLMVRIRDGSLPMSTATATALLATVDATRDLMAAIEATGAEDGSDIEALVVELARLTRSEEAEADDDEPTRASTVEPAAATPNVSPAESVTRSVAPPGAPGESMPSPERATPKPDDNAGRRGEGDARGGSVADSSVRVSVDALDRLMNLVGELVLVRNQILRHSAAATQAPELAATSQRLNHVTTELQEGIMKTRMQQIGSVWDKLPRLVRDLARTCGKQVRVEMKGKDTELDRTIIEAIRDPLTHLVRNAVDHGLESPEERREVGKPREGLVSLRAYHEGGQVNIEISDDGGGLRVEKLKQRAIERGLVTADQVDRMTDREAANLIFLPGFSTAETVTNVSGRGVGMDVVKTNIERIGGAIDIQTSRGRGTTFKVKIPLTLAIIPALIVRAGGDRYAIPQVSLVELVRLEGEQRSAIEHIHETPLVRLRGNLLPLVDLAHELQVPTEALPEVLHIVVLQADGQQFGLVVDAIQDTEEIVVKPLGARLKGLDVFAGATIMGDGRVALILDVLGLAQRSNVLQRRGAQLEIGRTEKAENAENDHRTLLLFDVGGSVVAVPLGLVDRLEEVDAKTIERSGPMDVVQYRGAILPLADLHGVVGGAGPSERERAQVVVFSFAGRRVGLLVDRFVDIVDTEFHVDEVSRRRGILGSAIVQGRVIQMLELDRVLADVFPTLAVHA
ncbi:MAG: chemotaxis protein CheW [Sandaracinus sp.]|nr:chemotaxis protein CheW [Sandaracinus sp.]MCB9616709.1 chemotaxis protein CheW [Sandaracinus sp.]MCB9623981.1 chemotaxis protein CheW [Sandaracinus sp.]MCB9632503.1 chemotaxis protein CheW [Sandaracinus sp.]